MALVTHPDVDKVAFTGSTEIGKQIGAGVAGTDKALTLELGGKAANIVFDDAPLDQAVEGIVNGIYFNQGEVCCAGVAPARPGVDRRAAHRQAQGPPGDAARRRPARQEHRRRRDQHAAQLEKITELVEAGVAEGAELYQPACDLPDARLLLPPDAVHERRPEPPDRARGDLRAGAVGAHLPDARTRRSRRRTTRPTACRPGSGPTRAAGSSRWSASCGPASSGRTRSTGSTRPAPFGGYKESGFGREGGLHGLLRLRPAGGPLMARPTRAVAKPAARGRRWPRSGSTSARPTSSTSAARSRAPSRAARTSCARADGTPLANACRGSRKDLRDAVRAARGRRSRLGREDGDEPRPDPLPRGRADGGPARPVRRRGRPRPRARRLAAARGLGRPGHRPLGLVRRLGRQDRPGARLGRTRSRRRTSTSPSPSRPGVVGVVAPETSSLLGLVSRLAPALVGGNTVVVLASESAAAAGRDADRGPGHLGRAGRRRQPPHRAAQASSCRSLAGARGRRRDRRLGRAPDELRRPSRRRAAENVKRVARRAARRWPSRFDWLDDRAAERPEWIAAFLEMKTVWHPIGV